VNIGEINTNILKYYTKFYTKFCFKPCNNGPPARAQSTLSKFREHACILCAMSEPHVHYRFWNRDMIKVVTGLAPTSSWHPLECVHPRDRTVKNKLDFFDLMPIRYEATSPSWSHTATATTSLAGRRSDSPPLPPVCNGSCCRMRRRRARRMRT
jgi:hypothetical protein